MVSGNNWEREGGSGNTSEWRGVFWRCKLEERVLASGFLAAGGTEVVLAISVKIRVKGKVDSGKKEREKNCCRYQHHSSHWVLYQKARTFGKTVSQKSVAKFVLCVFLGPSPSRPKLQTLHF